MINNSKTITNTVSKQVFIKNYKNELYFYSLKIEKKQTNYTKNLQNLKNIKTGQVIIINYNYDSKQKAYVKTIEQKVNALVSLSKTEELVPLFLTLTLPSKFHPYKTSKKGIKNKNHAYKYENIEDSITEGYQELRDIYRSFYKRVKNYSKNIYYIKVVEPHKSLTPHMHVILFIEPKQLEITKQLFYKVCKEHKLKRVEFDESLLTDDINNAVGYIMKYILKTLNSKDEYFKRWLDGWRKKHRIRGCEMSNLPLSIEVYKKLYYSLPKELKESIQKEIEEKNQSFFEYFIRNTTVTQTIYEEKI